MSNRRAPNNRTLTLSQAEREELSRRLLTPYGYGADSSNDAHGINGAHGNSSEDGGTEGGADAVSPKSYALTDIVDRTIHGELTQVLPLLPDGFADLIVADPPYNLTKSFGTTRFGARTRERYHQFTDTWLPAVRRKLKPGGTMYVCGDWRSASALEDALVAAGLTIANRITWQREKGRGASHNWKNAMEDIWMAVDDMRDYYFNVGAVMQKRRVIAPYRDAAGTPRDWQEVDAGGGTERYRLTHPSNLWDDITVPFWSMAENTDHPTQKPEKLLAKLILASSRPGDTVFDPFVGSGTTSVVARKLGRHYVGVERELTYCLYTEKRLAAAAADSSIQGYSEGVFWDRNTGR